MASKKIKGLQIQIGADYQGLDTALKEVEKGGKKAASELREIKRTMDSAGESAQLWAQKQKVLSTALDESKKKLNFLEEAQEQVNKQFKEEKIDEEQYRAFQREVEYARSAVKKYEAELQNANTKVQEFGKESGNTAGEVKELGDKTEGAGKQADNAAKGGFTVLKGALADLVADGIRTAAGEFKDFTGDIIRTGAEFEGGMSSVAAISGATSAELEKLTAKAEEMGATTRYTASEAAEAFSYMALAGWKTEDMLNGIDGVLSLAAASNMELGTASDIVTDYLTAFGLTAKDSTHFVDLMSYAMANSNTTTEMLGEAYKNCAATAASMGYSVEETTAVLMTMANAGIKGGEAGTALNAIMTRLATDTKGCATALKEYGVDVYDAEGNMQTLTSILEGVSGVWGELNDQQQAAMAKTLAGTNHYAALQTIMNGLSDTAKESGMSFGDYNAALKECDGTALNMSHTMLDNLQGDMVLLDSAVDGMKISLAKELNPEIRKGVQYLTKSIPTVEKTLSGFFKTGIKGLKLAAEYAPKVTSAAQVMKPVIIGTLSAIAAYKTAKKIDDAVKSIKALNIAMSATPYTAVALGVAAVATAFIAFADSEKEVKTFAEEAAEEFSEERKAISDVSDSLSELNDAFYASAAETNNEMKRTEDLWKELDKLTDSTGKVKEADKKRAEYILGELNTALGTEYTMTGNQIDQYKKMGEEVDKLIAKKKAAAYLDSYTAQSAEYAKNQAESRASYETAYANYNSADEAVKRAAKKIEMLYGSELGITADDLINPKSEDIVAAVAGKDHRDKIRLDLYNEWQKALAERTESKLQMNLSQDNYTKAIEYQSRLDEAEKAFENGDYKSVSSILYDPIDADKYTLKNETDLEKRAAAFQNLIEKSKGDFQLAIKSNSQYAVDEALDALKETFEAGSLTGEDLGKTFADNFAESVQAMIDKGYDISSLSKWAKTSGVKVGDIFKKDFGKVVQSQIDKGYDITALTEWARSSGVRITDVFGKNMDFEGVIRQQIEGGHDIRGLLAWAEEAGYKVGNEYDSKFTDEVQKALNEFYPDDSKMVQWAIDKGMTIGELYGEHFAAYANQYLYENNDLIPRNINSVSDAQYYASGSYTLGSHGITKSATGNYIGAGKQSLIAEAGPELLEVMNGGIKITPLSRSATNTPVGGGTENKYYQYFYVTANVSNDYDVRRLSEQLGKLSQSSNYGKGVKTV